jgi:hypothetical protein
MELDHLGDIVELAYRYGPFAFGVMLVIIAAKLKRSASSKGLIWANFGAGVFFMLISVGVWLRQPGLNVYEGTFRNLTPYERLTSDDVTFFSREELESRLGDDEEQLRNVRFAVIRPQRFSRRDAFQIDYRKQGGPREIFSVPYSPDRYPAFVIRWDDKQKKNVLQPAGEAVALARWPFERLARAQGGLPPPAAERARESAPTATRRPRTAAQPAAPRPSTLNAGARKLVAVLQDPHSPVGAKIAALDELGRYDGVGIRVLMNAATERGPVAATLLDLGRHSDAELASKARALLARYDLVPGLARALEGPDPRARDNARLVVEAMDPASADRVLQALPPGARERVEPGGDQPVATGSSQGDRYYIRATWDPRSAPVVDCLTRFFNGALESTRTLADEQGRMAGRSDRLVYAFGREQALDMAAQIRKCGAAARFVVPWKS